MTAAATVSDPVLVLRDIRVSYPGSDGAVVEEVNLSLEPGQRLALLGLNGSGKTTLLLVPAGLIPFTGRAEVSGLEVVKANLAAVRRRIGFLFAVPEDQILFPRVLDDVLFTLDRRGVGGEEAREEARRMLRLVRIGELEARNPHALSHGERMRVALAGALVGESELLLLDEPSAALDPPGRAALAALLTGLPPAMIIATHDLAFARTACTHWTVLDAGRLRGPVRPIADLPADPLQIWPGMPSIR